MKCPRCGAELNRVTAFCPHCGVRLQGQSVQLPHGQPQPVIPAGAPPFNNLCIAGVIVSGLSLLQGVFGVAAIAGLVLSIVGLHKCGQTGERGRELAIAGIVLGVLAIVFGLVALAVQLNDLSAAWSDVMNLPTAWGELRRQWRELQEAWQDLREIM